MKKIWAAVICAILFVGIEVFAYGAGRREKSVAVLQSQVRTQNILAETGESTSEEETDHAEEETVYQESEPEATASSAARSLPMGILCIGDEFLTRQDAAEHSYTVVLQAYLEAAGWQLPVVNEGIGQSGSLSIMKYAGVPDEIVHQYAASHPIVIATSSGSMAQESFETAISEFPDGILDVSQYKEYLPVLFMAYYGGWNKSPEELADQQKEVLQALDSNYGDLCVVIGLATGDTGQMREEYERVMEDTWGERYISVAREVENPAASNSGQAEIGTLAGGKIVSLLEALE